MIYYINVHYYRRNDGHWKLYDNIYDDEKFVDYDTDRNIYEGILIPGYNYHI